MNMIISFSIEVVITLVVCALLVVYLRKYLYRILIDLCGSEDRAQFWAVFSTILLIGIPFIISLSYRPEALTSLDLFFEIIGRVSGNLGAYLASLVGIGIIISIFALVAPRSGKAEAK